MITTKHTKTIIASTGSFILHINDIQLSVDMSDEQTSDFFLAFLDNSRKAETEADYLRKVASGDFLAARQYSSVETFEYPLSLRAFENEHISLGRAKGAVSAGSIEVVIKLEAGKDTIIGLSSKLDAIAGYKLISKKPSPVTDELGFPIASKYIVSPILK